MPTPPSDFNTSQTALLWPCKLSSLWISSFFSKHLLIAMYVTSIHREREAPGYDANVTWFPFPCHSGSQLGRLCSSGTLRQCLEIFLVVTTGRDVSGIQRLGKLLTIVQCTRQLTAKNCLAPNVSSASLPYSNRSRLVNILRQVNISA